MFKLEKDFFANRANMNNNRLSRAFYQHNKILIGAANGPVIGIVASILACCDFIYCFDSFWLSTLFTSLALVAEGGAIATFVRKARLAPFYFASSFLTFYLDRWDWEELNKRF